MIRSLFQQAVLFDTSAVIALHSPADRYHDAVRSYFSRATGIIWVALDVTSHECFTTVRYQRGYQSALEHYRFLRDSGFHLIRFEGDDEPQALGILQKYADHAISFHDALCAAAMLRIGIYRILTLDQDFSTLGFEKLPVIQM